MFRRPILKWASPVTALAALALWLLIPVNASASTPDIYATAIAAAKSKLGFACLPGGTGPVVFDAGGLTQWSYAQAGVAIPREPKYQVYAGADFGDDIDSARPGDLIVYYSDRHHVGMYVGGGQIIHASTAADVVRYASATSMPIYKIIHPYAH
ncbi:C40 family peptidase [Streptomyces sp. NPDC004065]|uniref:C40 family peptidase n=1 Tax=Streptomyces sp. NPDC004065 TaxID=3364689 RepID=UPI00384E1463